MRRFKTMIETLSIFSGEMVATSMRAADSLVLKGGSGQRSGGFTPVPWQIDLVPLVILLVGVGHLFWPRVAWWFKWGWRFQDSEPSTLWLFCERLGGVFIIAIAVGLFLVMNGVVHLPSQ
jgi:hypothetical protein